MAYMEQEKEIDSAHQGNDKYNPDVEFSHDEYGNKMFLYY